MRQSPKVSDLKRTLEELEGERWGEPAFPSHLVTTCHRLRKVPIEQLGVEDLRILLGQAIGVTYLVPLALEILDANPLARGDFYPGDLLCSVLGLDSQVWKQHPDWAERLKCIVSGIENAPRDIRKAREKFLSQGA